jgi:CheY-like chemotaxis protein
VLGAGNGLEALECLEHSGSDIHLVLTDIRMPRLGGLELGREIGVRRWSVPVVYMSADPPDALGGNAGAGRSPCLQKPFSMAALIATVHELLEANGARR